MADAARRMIASSRKMVEELGIAHRLFEANVFAGRIDLLEGDAEAAQESLDTLIVQALGAAQKQGNIPASFLEVIREVTRPKIDLETLLHTYLSESFFDKVKELFGTDDE